MRTECARHRLNARTYQTQTFGHETRRANFDWLGAGCKLNAHRRPIK